MVFTFGPTGSFGYCSAAPESQRKLGWWSNWGTADIPNGNVVDPEEIRRQLKERHGTWHDPVIQNIIEKMDTDRVYPIWTTPDLPHWGTGGAVLLGDAAHTLPATSGQGAGQALEDSVVFSLLLAHFMARVDAPGGDLDTRTAVELSIKGLYEIRHPRVATIKARSRNLYITSKKINNIFIEYMYYLFVYLWTNFPVLGEYFNPDTPNVFTQAFGVLSLTKLGLLIVGTVFRESDELTAEEQVKGYLKSKGY